jgi:hypothetical protein
MAVKMERREWCICPSIAILREARQSLPPMEGGNSP